MHDMALVVQLLQGFFRSHRSLQVIRKRRVKWNKTTTHFRCRHESQDTIPGAREAGALGASCLTADGVVRCRSFSIVAEHPKVVSMSLGIFKDFQLKMMDYKVKSWTLFPRLDLRQYS